MAKIRQIRQQTPEEKPKIRLAFYCRVSCNSYDQLNSLAAQIEYATRYADEHPEMELVGVFADEGLSGLKTDKRDELRRLMGECKRGRVDRIVCKSVSRFARNTADCLSLVRIIHSGGATIYFEKEDLDSGSMQGEFFLTMHGMGAQEESVSISTNLRWATRNRMADGTFKPGSAPYGYRLTDGELTVYEPEAAVVRQVYDWYLSGMGKKAITDRLNKNPQTRRNGQSKWNIHTVAYVLTNIRYMGDAVWQKKYTTEALPFKPKRNYGERPMYHVENANVPILSAEIFRAAQALAKTKAVTERRAKQTYPLTGRITCECGASYRRRVTNGTAYWECRDHNLNSGACGGVPLPETAFYETFLLMVNKLAAHRGDILPPLIAQLEKMQAKHSGAENKVFDIDRQIAELNRQNLVIARLHSRGILDTADYTAQSGAVNQKVNRLRSQRRQILADNDNAEVLDHLKTLDDTLAGIPAVQTTFDEALFADTVEQITVSNTNVATFRLIGGLTLRETIHYTERCVKK